MADAAYISIEHTPLHIKSFNFTHILLYTKILDDTHSIKTDHTSTLIKGQKLFADGFVTRVGHREVNTDGMKGHAVRATVKAEMKKLTSYDVTALIKSDNEVKSVTCQCPGSSIPACCKRAFALLSAVEDYSRLELFSAPTEKLQKWHQPKPVKVSPKKCNETLGATGRPTSMTSPSKAAKTETSVNLSALCGLPIITIVAPGNGNEGHIIQHS